MRLFLLFLLMPLVTGAQDQYVVLFAGDTLSGFELSFESPILQAPLISLDTSRYSLDEVALFRNDHGVFANVSHLRGDAGSFAMRVRGGRAAVLQNVNMEIYGGNELPQNLDTRAERRQLASDQMDYLYLWHGEVIKPNYRNMSFHFSASPEAMVHVKRMRRFQWLQRSLLAGGGGLMLAGVTTLDGTVSFSPTILLGMLLAGSSYFTSQAINDDRWMAVEAYNAVPTSP